MSRAMVKQRLRNLADTAMADAAAGDPSAWLVAWTVAVRVEYIIAGHPGDGEDCDDCTAQVRARYGGPAGVVDAA